MNHVTVAFYPLPEMVTSIILTKDKDNAKEALERSIPCVLTKIGELSEDAQIMPLEEGDLVKLGDDEMQVIFLPGHSAGSIAFYSKQHDFIIAGDVIFKQSIGRTDLPGGDFDTLMNSIKEKLFLLPDSTKIYAGHGFETTIGEEKVGNPFL
jgi:glyoxylase-like metal-dependent hydrolase (beta-lactamase superfamily II)